MWWKTEGAQRGGITCDGTTMVVNRGGTTCCGATWWQTKVAQPWWHNVIGWYRHGGTTWWQTKAGGLVVPPWWQTVMAQCGGLVAPPWWHKVGGHQIEALLMSK